MGLARERVRLQELELEISHQLAFAVRDLEADLVLTQTNFNRREAAKRNVDAVSAAYESGTIGIDVLLQAQRLLAQGRERLLSVPGELQQSHFRLSTSERARS